jgi:hypothetical protein
MKRALLVGLILLSITDVSARDFKPAVMPLLSDTRAFLVEVRNTGERSLEVQTWGLCRMRIDGKDIAKEPPNGSAGVTTIKQGESWRELVRLVKERPSGRRVPNPLPFQIVGNEAIVVHIATGRHTVAFSCGGEWSDDLAFYWIEGVS